MRQNLKVHSGNRIVVEADGKRLGLITSWRPSDSYGLEKASGVGDIHVQEFVPSIAGHTIAVSTMHLFTANMQAAGIIPGNGDDALKGLEFDFVAYSRDTGLWLVKYIGCVFDSGDTSVDAHRIVTKSATFQARDKATNGF